MNNHDDKGAFGDAIMEAVQLICIIVMVGFLGVGFAALVVATDRHPITASVK